EVDHWTLTRKCAQVESRRHGYTYGRRPFVDSPPSSWGTSRGENSRLLNDPLAPSTRDALRSHRALDGRQAPTAPLRYPTMRAEPCRVQTCRRRFADGMALLTQRQLKPRGCVPGGLGSGGKAPKKDDVAAAMAM